MHSLSSKHICLILRIVNGFLKPHVASVEFMGHLAEAVIMILSPIFLFLASEKMSIESDILYSAIILEY